MARGTRGKPSKGARPDSLAVVKPVDYTLGPITSIQKFLKGGKKEFMELARFAPQIEPELAVIIEVWDKLSFAVKQRTRIEDICASKQIDAFHFFSVVNEAAMRFKDNATLMLTSMHSPALLEQSIKFGMKKDGWPDRQAVLQGAGVFPTPQGTRISILNSNSARAAAQSEANVERGLPTFERSISDMEDE